MPWFYHSLEWSAKEKSGTLGRRVQDFRLRFGAQRKTHCHGGAHARSVETPCGQQPGIVGGVTTTEYEDDEFDRAADTQPAGAHRQPVSRLKLAWPFLVAIILAPLLAWAVVTLFLTDSEQSPEATPSAQVSQSAAPTTTSAPVRKDAPVTVYNAVGTQGLAATAAQKLTAEGFTSVNATNSAARGITQTTVYYTRDELKESAQAAAKALNIATVTAKPAGYQMPDGIVIYLLKDFSGVR